MESEASKIKKAEKKKQSRETFEHKEGQHTHKCKSRKHHKSASGDNLLAGEDEQDIQFPEYEFDWGEKCQDSHQWSESRQLHQPHQIVVNYTSQQKLIQLTVEVCSCHSRTPEQLIVHASVTAAFFFALSSWSSYTTYCSTIYTDWNHVKQCQKASHVINSTNGNALPHPVMSRTSQGLVKMTW